MSENTLEPDLILYPPSFHLSLISLNHARMLFGLLVIINTDQKYVASKAFQNLRIVSVFYLVDCTFGGFVPF
jgi:hypothetical protein